MHVLEIVSLMLREQVGFYNVGFTLNSTCGVISWGIFLNLLNNYCEYQACIRWLQPSYLLGKN